MDFETNTLPYEDDDYINYDHWKRAWCCFECGKISKAVMRRGPNNAICDECLSFYVEKEKC